MNPVHVYESHMFIIIHQEQNSSQVQWFDSPTRRIYDNFFTVKAVSSYCNADEVRATHLLHAKAISRCPTLTRDENQEEAPSPPLCKTSVLQKLNAHIFLCVLPQFQSHRLRSSNLIVSQKSPSPSPLFPNLSASPFSVYSSTTLHKGMES